jgi:hypothetical protein
VQTEKWGQAKAYERYGVPRSSNMKPAHASGAARPATQGEQQARSGRAGIWGARDEQDDQTYQLQR